MTKEQPHPSRPPQPNRRPELDETLAPDDLDTTPDGDLSAEAIPESLGRYAIKKLLGRGGMGSVYLAHDSQLARDVALKVPKFDAKANEKSIARFYREARAAANLSHPNLCQVFDVGEIDETHYIAMAFIKGRPLSDYIIDGKRLNPRSAASIVRKVAVGMQEAHQSGIIHRDLKPANIMIDHRNEPIVMDFGLAVTEQDDTESRLTQDGALIGSPAYMSPEQLRGELDAIGPASDVYALGVVLYELLSGRLPFDGSGSTIAMIGQILTTEAVKLTTIRQDLDPQIIAICDKAMRKDAAERYGSMSEFAAALAACAKPKSASGKSLEVAKATTTVTIAEIQINEKAKLAKTLCDTKQFAAAVPILEQIVASTESKGSKAFEYARTMLPKVQEQIAKQASAAMAAEEPPADDPFADLPENPLGEAAGYRPPAKRKSSKKVAGSSGISKAVLAGGGIGVAAICAAIGFVFWPPLERANELSPVTNQAIIETDPVPVVQDSSRAQNEFRRSNDGPREGFRDRGPRLGRLEQQLVDLDSDGDGQVLRSEVPETLKSLFGEVDRNDDGRLDVNEIDEMKRADQQRREGGGPGGGGPGRRGPGSNNTGQNDPGANGPGRNNPGRNGPGVDRPARSGAEQDRADRQVPGGRSGGPGGRSQREDFGPPR